MDDKLSAKTVKFTSLKNLYVYGKCNYIWYSSKATSQVLNAYLNALCLGNTQTVSDIPDYLLQYHHILYNNKLMFYHPKTRRFAAN